MENVVSEVFGIWFLIGAVLVFFMQAGFAMVEVGFTRAKNAGNIIMKNLMDFCLGAVAFLSLGYILLCGNDVGGFIGWMDISESPLFNFANTDWSAFIFNLVFCATTATIVSGAMAERTKFISYCIYSVVLSLLVYPIEAHWIWGGGWLSQLGFHDFAGSSAIHLVGGVSALVGAKILGPRIGKFNKDGTPNGIPGHSITMGALGCFILWFGWYGFNGAAATNGFELATIFATTTIAPALATITVMIFTWLKYGKPDVAMSLNGSLAGLVAITAGCDAVDMFGAAMIGILAGLVVLGVVWLLDYKLRIDDPVGAVAVHGGCGLLGTLCVGLFASGTSTMPEAAGLLYGGGFDLLFVQAIGVVAVFLWSFITMTIVFLLIKKTIGLRVSAQEELLGLDKLEHGLDNAYAGFTMCAEAMENEQLTDVIKQEEVLHKQITPKPPIIKSTHINENKISKVVIVMKSEMFSALKKELQKIGITGITATNVLGCGVQKGILNYYRGAKVDMQLLPKLKVEIVVSSIPVDTVIKRVCKVLHTGNAGDGKIFVYNVENVIRISSGVEGVQALQYED